MTRAALLLLPLSLLLACRTPSPGVPLPADDPRPALLIESLRERADGRSALRARAKLDLSAPDLRLSRPQRMAVARPMRLRVEVLGLFGQLAAVLVTDGEFYQVYDAREGGLEEGLVSAGLLWRVARVDLSPAQAVDLLLASPVPAGGLTAGAARLLADGVIEVDRRDERGVARERFRFDAGGRLAAMESYDRGGALLWRARFSGYRELPAPGGGAEPFPFDIELDFPRVEAEARLSYKSVDLAGDLPDELFVLRLAEQSAERVPREGAGGRLGGGADGRPATVGESRL